MERDDLIFDGMQKRMYLYLTYIHTYIHKLP